MHMIVTSRWQGEPQAKRTSPRAVQQGERGAEGSDRKCRLERGGTSGNARQGSAGGRRGGEGPDSKCRLEGGDKWQCTPGLGRGKGKKSEIMLGGGAGGGGGGQAAQPRHRCLGETNKQQTAP
jgi:hypothetical protein